MTGYPVRASIVEDPFDPGIGSSKSQRKRGGEHRASLNVPGNAISAIVDVATIASTNLRLSRCARTDSNLLSCGFGGDVPQNHSIKGMLDLEARPRSLSGQVFKGTVRFYGMARIMNSPFRDSLAEIMQPIGPTRRRAE